MTTTLTPAQRSLSWIRVVAGSVVLVVLVAAVIAYVVGFHSDNVFLRQYFGDPVLGIAVVLVLSIVALMLLTPVRDEASQRWRSRVRLIQVILTGLALIAYGLFGAQFSFEPRAVAHSADNARTAAMVGPNGNETLHIFVGHGLSARDRGDVGHPCGYSESIAVSFSSDGNVLTVNTEFGTYTLHLDPATGRPVDKLPATCGG